MMIIIIIITIIIIMMMMMMMMMIITIIIIMRRRRREIIIIIIIMIMIIIVIIPFKFAIRDCLQSPHCAANRLQHVRSSGPATIVCKSCATHRALITTALVAG